AVGGTASPVELDLFLNFLAFHVLLELIKIELKHAGVGAEKRERVRRLTPNCLFAEEQVVHRPELSLLPSRFSGTRRVLCPLVVRQRKIAINHAQIVLLLQLIDRLGELAARRTLEIPELFQCYRRVRRCEVGKNPAGAASRPREFWRSVGGALGKIKECAAADRQQRDQNNDDKGQESFHEKGRKI